MSRRGSAASWASSRALKWMSAWSSAGLKSEAVARLTIRQQLAYKTDFLLRGSFLLLILFVFAQLWTAAYGADGSAVIGGFTKKDIVWYLVFTEALTMAAPPLAARVEEEVKNGDIAVRLLRPLSYLGYHYAAYMAEAFVRFALHLGVGALIAWPFVGAPGFGWGWLYLPLLGVGALSVLFFLHAIVALCAFWVEETSGLQFVLQKLQFTIGGMLLPIDLMPEWLQRICIWLPFQAAMYVPASSAVHPDPARALRGAAAQAAWIALLGTIAVYQYRRGARKLHVNGG